MIVPYPLTTADRVEIYELPGRYGDAIDDRDWTRLDRVFTQDAVFDLTGVGSRICNGLDDIKAFMELEAAHPRTHMMTNIYAESDEHAVELRFLCLRGIIGAGGGRHIHRIPNDHDPLTGRSCCLGTRISQRRRQAALYSQTFLYAFDDRRIYLSGNHLLVLRDGIDANC